MTFTLTRAPELAPAEWHAFTTALTAALSHINLNRPTDPINPTAAIIYGPFGEGSPLVGAERVCFNGNYRTHKWLKANPATRLPEDERDDTHEAFDLYRMAPNPPRAGFQYAQTATAGKPYAVAVRVALILLRHFFPLDTAIIDNPATPDQWEHALRYATIVVPTAHLPVECCPRS